MYEEKRFLCDSIWNNHGYIANNAWTYKSTIELCASKYLFVSLYNIDGGWKIFYKQLCQIQVEFHRHIASKKLFKTPHVSQSLRCGISR